jgi:hypothetical protein
MEGSGSNERVFGAWLVVAMVPLIYRFFAPLVTAINKRIREREGEGDGNFENAQVFN